MTSTPLKPVKSGSLNELVYQQIRRAIVHGEFVMGQQLIEAQLVAQLAVSRSPIREALRRLSEEGLVIDLPRRGTFVRTINVEDLIDVYNTRLAVESVAARLIARKRRSMAVLETALAEMFKAVEGGNRMEFVACDLDFHAALCATSGNAHLSHVFRALSAQIQMAISADEEARDDLRDIAEGHLPLIEILRNGTEAQASSAAQEHILSTARKSVMRLGGNGADLLEPLEAAT